MASPSFGQHFGNKIEQFFLGKPKSSTYTSKLAPQQDILKNMSIGQAMGLLQNPRNVDFGPIENQARQNYQQKTIPALAERFTSRGSGRSSSAFQGALGESATGLESQLAALRSKHELGQQGLEQNLLKLLLGHGLKDTGKNETNPEESGFLENAAPGIVELLVNLIPGIGPFLAKPAGALTQFGTNALGEWHRGKQGQGMQGMSGVRNDNLQNIMQRLSQGVY